MYRKRIFRSSIMILTLTISFGLVVWVSGPLRNQFEKKAQEIQNSTITWLENTYDIELSYSTISPSIFRYFEIRDVRLVHRDFVMEFQRVRVYFRFLDILRGDFVESLRDIRFDQGEVEIHLSESKGLVQDSIATDPFNFAQLTPYYSFLSQLPYDLRIHLRNVSISVNHPTTTVETYLEQGTITGGQENLSLRFFTRIDARNRDFGLFSGSQIIRMQINPVLERTEVFLTLVNSQTPIADIGDIDIQLLLIDNRLQLSKTFDRLPFDFTVVFSEDFSTYEASLRADNWVPSSFIFLQPGFLNATLQDLFHGRVSGSYDLFYSEDIHGPRYSYLGTGEYRGAIVSRFDGVLDVDFYGDDSRIQFNRFTYTGNDSENLVFQGDMVFDSFLPQGRLSFHTGKLVPLGVIKGDFLLERQTNQGDDQGFLISADNFTIFENRVQDFAISLNDHQTSDWKFQLNTELDSGGSVDIKGLLGNPFETPLDELLDSSLASIQIQDFSLQSLSAIIENLDLLSDEIEFLKSSKGYLNLDSSVYFSGNKPGIRIDSLEIFSFHDQIPEISLQGRYLNSMVILDGLQFSQYFTDLLPSEIILRGRGYVPDISQFNFYVVSKLFETEIDLTAYYSHGGLAIESNLGIKGQFLPLVTTNSSDEPASWDVEIAGSLMVPPIPQLSFLTGTDVFLRGNIQENLDWEVYSSSIELPLVDIPLLHEDGGRVILSSSGNQNLLNFGVKYSDANDIFDLQGILRVAQMKDGLMEVPISLINRVSNENGEFLLDISSDSLGLNGEINDVMLSRLPIAGVGGTGKIEISIFFPFGDSRDSRIQGALSFDDGLFNRDPLRGIVRVDFDNDLLLFDGSRLTLANTHFSTESTSLDFSKKKFESTFLVNDTFSLSTILEYDNFTDLAKLDGFFGSIQLSPIPVFLSPESEIQLQYSSQLGIIEFSGGPQGSISGFYDVSGELALDIAAPMLIRLSAGGTIKNGEFDVNIPRIEWMDADYSSILDFGIFGIQRGNVLGNARLTGDINDPSFFGSASVQNLYADFEYVSETIGPGNAFLVFEDKFLYFPEFTIPIDETILEVSGFLEFSRWVPTNYEFLFSVLSTPGLAIQQDFDSVVVDGLARGSVAINGTMENIQIRGDITASQAAITLSPVAETVIIQERESPIFVDVELTIRSDRGVEFFWPNQDIPIFRAFVNPGESIVLKVNTGAQTYSLQGTASILGGELFYIDRNFYVREGSIIFNETQEAFNPRVTLLAESRTQWQGQRIVLSLSVLENYLSDLQPRISSNPPLSSEILGIIVGGNLFPASGEEGYNIFGEALLATADVVSQFAVLRNFENNIRNTLNLDLFSIRTGLFQNLLRDVVLPDDASSLNNPFSRYLQNTTVQLGKLLGEGMFFELLVELAETDPLTRGSQDVFGLSINPEFRVEWDTPFFLMEWSWIPINSQNLFVTDHKLTFLWELDDFIKEN